MLHQWLGSGKFSELIDWVLVHRLWSTTWWWVCCGNWLPSANCVGTVNFPELLIKFPKFFKSWLLLYCHQGASVIWVFRNFRLPRARVSCWCLSLSSSDRSKVVTGVANGTLPNDVFTNSLNQLTAGTDNTGAVHEVKSSPHAICDWFNCRDE